MLSNPRAHFKINCFKLISPNDHTKLKMFVSAREHFCIPNYFMFSLFTKYRDLEWPEHLQECPTAAASDAFPLNVGSGTRNLLQLSKDLNRSFIPLTRPSSAQHLSTSKPNVAYPKYGIRKRPASAQARTNTQKHARQEAIHHEQQQEQLAETLPVQRPLSAQLADMYTAGNRPATSDGVSSHEQQHQQQHSADVARLNAQVEQIRTASETDTNPSPTNLSRPRPVSAHADLGAGRPQSAKLFDKIQAESQSQSNSTPTPNSAYATPQRPKSAHVPGEASDTKGDGWVAGLPTHWQQRAQSAGEKCGDDTSGAAADQSSSNDLGSPMSPVNQQHLGQGFHGLTSDSPESDHRAQASSHTSNIAQSGAPTTMSSSEMSPYPIHKVPAQPVYDDEYDLADKDLVVEDDGDSETEFDQRMAAATAPENLRLARETKYNARDGGYSPSHMGRPPSAIRPSSAMSKDADMRNLVTTNFNIVLFSCTLFLKRID